MRQYQAATALVILATVIPLRATAAGPSVRDVPDQVYRWTDARGCVHFSNVPAPGSEPTGIVAEENAPAAAEAVPSQAGESDEGMDEPVPPQQESALDPDEAEAVAQRVAIERSGLEREMKQAQRELRDLDAQLAGLAQARTAHARGTAETGGVGTAAEAYRSDDEKALITRREATVARVDQMRARYGKLRAEVTTALGTTPSWWIDAP